MIWYELRIWNNPEQPPYGKFGILCFGASAREGCSAWFGGGISEFPFVEIFLCFTDTFTRRGWLMSAWCEIIHELFKLLEFGNGDFECLGIKRWRFLVPSSPSGPDSTCGVVRSVAKFVRHLDAGADGVKIMPLFNLQQCCWGLKRGK